MWLIPVFKCLVILLVTHMECNQMICHLTSDMGRRKRSKYNLLYELCVSGSKE